MARLVVVSNRIAGIQGAGGASAGGLAMALSASLREHGGLWFGWSGNTCQAFNAAADVRDRGDLATATIDLEPQDVDEYYNGFANRTIWPLCHYRIDLAAYERSFGSGYARVNARFAEALVPLLRSDDVIWVHDYHLIPLARELRRRGITNKIGFFFHIPWPIRQVLVTLPRHHELVQSMFHYDLVGFQTADYLDAFRDYVVEELEGVADADGRLTAFGRVLTARAYPIGIDVAEMATLVQSKAGSDSFAKRRAMSGNQKMIIGVDRIDYTKGLPEKFDAYEQFLKDNPDCRGEVFLLQIGQPSRSTLPIYTELGAHLQEEAGRINGEYGTMDWSPLRYRSQSMPRDVLAGAYRAARAALVTPLRDGMNLVAKEFIAAQDPNDPGVLILSRFAGAAIQMREALLVNPYSREDVAEAIARAVAMPLSERVVRWKALYAGLVRDDLTAWRKSFMRDLVDGGANDSQAEAGKITLGNR